jgi:hypothetical protein
LSVTTSMTEYAMDREEWQIHMDLAERRVAEGLAQIERQQRLIQDLEGNGGDATRAQALLTSLLESQGRYEQHRDRLQRELALQPKEAPAPLPYEESPELARHVTDDPQDDSDRGRQAEAVDQEADRWMQVDAGNQKREP